MTRKRLVVGGSEPSACPIRNPAVNPPVTIAAREMKSRRDICKLAIFWCAIFVCVVQIHVGLNVFAVGESIELFFDDQTGSTIVSPTPLDDERIPNQDLLLIRSLSTLKAPFQQFLVRPALDRFCRQLIVVYLPEAAKARIEAHRIGEAQMIAIGQEPQGIEADFVQHAGKEDNAG